MNKFWIICIFTFSSLLALAQTPNLLTTSPAIVYESNGQNIDVIVNATQGNQGLQNYSPSSDVYVHTGLITNLSSGPSDWKYVKFNQVWNQTNPALQATYLGNNIWKFSIPSDLRAYYGVTNPNEKILKIAILFRSGNGSVKLANTDNSDMYINVYNPTTLDIAVVQPSFEPKYNPIAKPISISLGQNLFIKAYTTIISNIELILNGNIIQSISNADSISTTVPITQGCHNQLITKATANNVTVYDTFDFFVLPTSTIMALPTGLRDGININMADSSISFVLLAPKKTSGVLLGDFNNFQANCNYTMHMTPDSMRLWYRLAGLTPGSTYRYQYLIDGVLRFADPYSELILDPWNDQGISTATYPNMPTYPSQTTGIVGVVKMDTSHYIFQNAAYTKPSKENLIIYELLVRDFVSKHDWKTMKDTLSYLKNLGINAIELMPINEFEGNSSWGYNPDYFFAPDKYYGNSTSLKEFVDAAHGLGMAVIMDIAMNHVTGLSPLAMLYWNNATNKPSADNPWLNVDAKHPFNVFNDFNHQSPYTKYHVHRVIEHWLKDYDIDGFRWDLSKGFTQVNSGNDVNAWGQYDTSRIAIWNNYFAKMQNVKPGSYCILEHFAVNQEEQELAGSGMLLWNNQNYAVNQNTMGYVTGTELTSAYAKNRGFSKLGLVSYAESHDEERLMYKNIQYGNVSVNYNVKDLLTGLKRNEAMNVMHLLIPGPKMVWQFGADQGYDYSINTCIDGSVNNNCRLDPKPIKWDYLQNTARKRLYDVMADILRLRRNYPEVFDTFSVHSLSQLGSGLDKILVLEHDQLSLVMVANMQMNNKSYNLDFPSSGNWYNYNDSAEVINYTGTSVTRPLLAGDYVIFVNKKVQGGHVVTNIHNEKLNDNIQCQIIPNPNGGQFQLKISTSHPNSEYKLSLFNSLGQNIWQNNILIQNNLSESIILDNSIPKGFYNLLIENQYFVKSEKIIIE